MQLRLREGKNYATRAPTPIFWLIPWKYQKLIHFNTVPASATQIIRLLEAQIPAKLKKKTGHANLFNDYRYLFFSPGPWFKIYRYRYGTSLKDIFNEEWMRFLKEREVARKGKPTSRPTGLPDTLSLYLHTQNSLTELHFFFFWGGNCSGSNMESLWILEFPNTRSFVFQK
jgi:hypothetical protein